MRKYGPGSEESGRREAAARLVEMLRGRELEREGATLASKALIERLDSEDAATVGVDPDHIVYRTVAELPGAGEKSIRDAGGIAVARLVGADGSTPPAAGNDPA